MQRQGLLFPGQGKLAVGMGRDLADAFPSARRTFEEAGEELGIALDDVCFNGPAEVLSRNDVAQPAILATGIAALRAMEEASGAPVSAEATAGLSLGEYAALVAAGALAFRQAVRLVQQRGAAMQRACEANPGTMYAVIGLDDDAVETACDTAREQTGTGVWPANYNCPGELVISGEVEAAAAAAAACSEMGARLVKQLDVAGAFHTAMMAPAAEELRPALAEADLRAPHCPVVANVTGRPTDDPEEIRDLLYRQVTSPVRWADSLRWFAAEGIEQCCEVGPGRVIRGHLRRTAATVSCVNVGTADEVRQYAGAGQ